MIRFSEHYDVLSQNDLAALFVILGAWMIGSAILWWVAVWTCRACARIFGSTKD
jgi:hypothetical protein